MEGLVTKDDLSRARLKINAKVDATYWKVMAGVAVLLLANVAATWGVVASYAMRGSE